MATTNVLRKDIPGPEEMAQLVKGSQYMHE